MGGGGKKRKKPKPVEPRIDPEIENLAVRRDERRTRGRAATIFGAGGGVLGDVPGIARRTLGQ